MHEFGSWLTAVTHLMCMRLASILHGLLGLTGSGILFSYNGRHSGSDENITSNLPQDSTNTPVIVSIYSFIYLLCLIALSILIFLLYQREINLLKELKYLTNQPTFANSKRSRRPLNRLKNSGSRQGAITCCQRKYQWFCDDSAFK